MTELSVPAVLQVLGIVSAATMPFWNIPLILRIVRRKSSDDISLAWVIGVEACVIGMLPSSIYSHDPVLKVLGITNSIFFTGVFIVVLLYHSRHEK